LTIAIQANEPERIAGARIGSKKKEPACRRIRINHQIDVNSLKKNTPE
jgi:hypothetical protein